MIYSCFKPFYICIKFFKIRIVTITYCMICYLRLSILINNLRYISFIFRRPITKPFKEFV
nr:MAG TPA: hypothetical protein [Caudoviricetes sp.]